MTKLEAYESALTLYGKIFLELPGRNARYFFGTIKRDFVFFLFALIWKGAGGASELKSKSRLIPKNFNEWTFGRRTILLANSPANPWTGTALWNIDCDYFRKNAPPLKNSRGITVLGCGIDFEKSFDLETLAHERNILGVEKKSYFHNVKSTPFFLQNCSVLFKIYRILKKNCTLRCSLIAFLRYFFYCAFVSARIREMIQGVAKNNNIGKIMSSDLDNVVGNSFILWARFYGLAQIAYPHGSPFFLNKNRYFEPEEYYIWTIYQKNYALETNSGKDTKFIYYPPKWATADAGQTPRWPSGPNPPLKIAIITAMEENLEIPLGNRETLLDSMEEIAKFAVARNILVYIKSHKLLDWHDDYDALCRKYNNVIHFKKRWRTEQLQNITIGVLMNTSTTMALQILALGIPVITCKDVMSEIVPKHFSAPHLQHKSENVASLLGILEGLVSDKKKYELAREQAVQIFQEAKLS